MNKRAALPKTGLELRDWLVGLFPDFVPGFGYDWRYEDNGSLTPHHVCSEFSDYYQRIVPDYHAPEVIEMFRVTEVICAADWFDADDVANALFTCFLENISYTEAGEAGRKHMGPRSRKFFDHWHRGFVSKAHTGS